jgi:hypothetical protein
MNAWGGGYRPPTWRQPVGWGTLHETPPIITAPVIREPPGDWLFNGLLRPAWAYRLELALFGLVSVAYVWLGDRLGREGAERLIVAAAFLVATITWTREPLAHALFRSHLRRRWALACRHAELATRNDRIPRITRCRLTRAGEQLRVRVPAGGQVPDLEAKAERIAAFLSVREVRVTRDPASARHARVVVLRRDPLADPAPTPWPLAEAGRLSLWQPIPVGTDEDGSPVTVSLPERNLLLGGEPGAGKSNVLQLLVAVGALDPDVRLTLFDPKLVVGRAGAGYDRWAELVAQAGYCHHPIRLAGQVEQADRASGEVRPVYDTGREPDGVLLKACGTRRESRCPSCAATYRADAYQLLAAGLKGGKGVPESVAGHPRLFVTFTAPSFGRVHTRKSQGRLVLPCHPYRQGARCPHGNRTGCWHRHDPDDPRLGEPLCPGCYDAQAQVLWNALAPELWRRTTIAVYRALGRLVGLQEGQPRRLVRISNAKVAEFQRRGAIHFHAVLRLDAATDCRCGGCLAPPPDRFTAACSRTPSGRPSRLSGCPAHPWRTGRSGMPAGASSSTSATSPAATTRRGSCRPSRWPATSPSTPPRPPRASAPASTAASTTATLTTWTSCPPMWPSLSAPPGSWAATPSCTAYGCGRGRTCSGSGATGRPRAAATRPPSPSCAGPGRLCQTAAGPRRHSPGRLRPGRGRPGRDRCRLLGLCGLGLCD